MIALQTRKKALLVESNLNRLRLQAEMNNLREAASFSKRFKHLGRFGEMAGMLAPLAAAVATFGLGRASLAGGILRKTLVAAPALVRLWRTVSSMLGRFK
ncbi:MAG TPA: hypothetical protein VGJ73_02405 [Verrucomicrobiae bacterium]